MKNYPALMQSLDSLGKVENVSVQRQDRTGAQIDEANAPADISIQVYSQGNIVSHESGLLATLRRTLAQSAGAIMWSLRMIGVAIAFLAPWVIALVAIVWIAKRISARATKCSATPPTMLSGRRLDADATTCALHEAPSEQSPDADTRSRRIILARSGNES